MKFSIITVCYNAAETIAAAMQSVLSQSYPDVEYLIIDGGSTDGTVERVVELMAADCWEEKTDGTVEKVVELMVDGCRGEETGGSRTYRLDGKTVVIRSEPDRGLYDALNKGIRLATGDIIGLVHADDFLAHSEVLVHVAQRFESSAADAVYGDLQYVRENSNRETREIQHGKKPRISRIDANAERPLTVIRHWRSGAFSRRRLNWGWMPPHPALYLKKTVYTRAVLPGGEYFDTAFRCAADYDFMLRILVKYNVEPVYLPEVLVKMRIGGISNGNVPRILRKSAEDWRAIRRNHVGHLHTLIAKNLRKTGQFFPGKKRRYR